MRKKEFREVQPDRTINSFQGNIVRFSGGRDGRVGGQESSVKRNGFTPLPFFLVSFFTLVMDGFVSRTG